MTADEAARIAHEAIHRHGAVQREAELATLLRLLDPPPRSVLEIGSHAGGTLWAWRAIGARRVVSVSLPDLVVAPDVAVDPHGADLIERDSQSLVTRGLVSAALPDGADLLFIDADHSYKGVSTDYQLYSGLVREGGWIALHDVLVHPDHPEVQVHRLWAELPRDRVLIAAPDFTWGGIGLVRRGHACPTCAAEALPAAARTLPGDLARLAEMEARDRGR